MSFFHYLFTLIFPSLIILTGNAETQQLEPEILEQRPHDPGAFTQGLLWHEGHLYESTGLYGRSSLRRVDPESGEVLQQINLPREFFAEGLELLDERLIQLTWRENTAFVYDLATFEQINQFSYDGEGWGLAYDGERLIMSNGSSELTFRDPETFAALNVVTVRLDGEPVRRLNELEYVNGFVYANVWQTDNILKIRPESGEVAAVIDASGLLTPQERQGADVLNGIAYNPQTERFYITGKLWPTMFEVNFVPKQEKAVEEKTAEPEPAPAIGPAPPP